MPSLNFTVDSALLRELGERLVGKPYIALGELVKNSYDADAFEVTIELDLVKDQIIIKDNGHGMDLNDFTNFWMRIGTTHKGTKRFSKYLNRPMTGSKGVGRLAVQFLAEKLTVITIPKGGRGWWLEAKVNWEDAIQAGDLTNASVTYNEFENNAPFEQGTKIILDILKNEWDKDAVTNLAAELWWLTPPFRESDLKEGEAFDIQFHSTEKEFVETFNTQLRAILGIWTAKFVGKNDNGKVSASLEFAGEKPRTFTYDISDFEHNNGIFDKDRNLRDGEFEIRIFTLERRQPRGIKVNDAREYFFKYGGVQVYDGGFRLPYYGRADNDWLGIQFDHAQRKFVSQLLPENIQKAYAHTGRLNFLPTLGRVFGVVRVNTANEQNLEIMITRDRLGDSIAYQDLVKMIRYAFDYYAYEEAKKQYQEGRKKAPTEPVSDKFEQIEQVLDHYKPQIPREVFKEIREKAIEATVAATNYQDSIIGQLGLLGPLATAGMNALALQHETMKQFSTIEAIIENIRLVNTTDNKLKQKLSDIEKELSHWLQRARETYSLFNYLADAENVKERLRLRAKSVIDDIKRQTNFLARGVIIDLEGVENDLYLPNASMAEWGAIFQNVFINAFNATLDTSNRKVKVWSRRDRDNVNILIEDSGIGINLKNAEKLFQPFERGLKLSQERRALGYGGTGLGLTIVRLLANNIGCKVEFVEPTKGFNTAFSISWREKSK